MQRLEVSGAVRPLYGSLGVKGLRMHETKAPPFCINSWSADKLSKEITLPFKLLLPCIVIKRE